MVIVLLSYANVNYDRLYSKPHHLEYSNSNSKELGEREATDKINETRELIVNVSDAPSESVSLCSVIQQGGQSIIELVDAISRDGPDAT